MAQTGAAVDLKTEYKVATCPICWKDIFAQVWITWVIADTETNTLDEHNNIALQGIIERVEFKKHSCEADSEDDEEEEQKPCGLCGVLTFRTNPDGSGTPSCCASHDER